MRPATSKPITKASIISSPLELSSSPIANVVATNEEPRWEIEGICVSSKSIVCAIAPLASAAIAALVFSFSPKIVELPFEF